MTVNDLIRRAMRSIGVLHHNEEPTSDEAADALSTLNDMLNAWIHEGIDLEFLNMELTDAFPYPDDHVSAVRYNLAVELAPEYGKQVSPVVAGNAQRGKMYLQAAYSDPDTLSTADMLQPSYSSNRTFSGIA